jgi:amphi-Trp domain-containing protein
VARDRFEFALIGSAEEIAEYLRALAAGLRRGEVALESGARALRLVPAGEVKLELRVTAKSRKGRVKVAIAWKRGEGARASDLRVAVDSPSPRA